MKGKRSQTTAALPAVPSKKNRAWKTFRNNKTLLLMCLPAVIFFIVFNYCPLPGVWIAFTSYNFRDGIFGSPFVGLSNFEFLISSGELWTLTKNTILYNLVFILLGNVFQIVIALMLNEIRSKFFKKVSQTIMFLPYFISAVLIGAIAFNILNYDTGALNALLRETVLTQYRFTAKLVYGPSSLFSVTCGSKQVMVLLFISRQSAVLIPVW